MKARPLTDYKYITEMDVKKGLEIPGDRYKSMHSCKEFMQVIADVETEKIKERFNQSKFVAVIVDLAPDEIADDNADEHAVQEAQDASMYCCLEEC